MANTLALSLAVRHAASASAWQLLFAGEDMLAEVAGHMPAAKCSACCALQGMEGIRKVFIREAKRTTVDASGSNYRTENEWMLDTEGALSQLR